MSTTLHRPAAFLRRGVAALGAAVASTVLASIVGSTTGAFQDGPDAAWSSVFWMLLSVGGVSLLAGAVFLGRAWGGARGGAVAPVFASTSLACGTCLFFGFALLAGTGTEPETSQPAPWVQAASGATAVLFLLSVTVGVIAGIAALRTPQR
jgi:hypothetical protein